MVALTWGGPNHVGAGALLVLWTMRLSAKLDVFLGVRNLAEWFFPDHLWHLRSFFRRRPANALFPFSVTGSTIACALLFGEAAGPDAGVFRAVGFTSLGTLMAMVVLEHWFMVLPLPFGTLLRRWMPATVDRSAGVFYDSDHGPVRASAASLLTMGALYPRGIPLQTTTAAPGRTEAR